MKDPTIYNVQVIDRIMHILSCFDDEHPVLGISQIAGMVDLHRATTHRLVTALANAGFLERAPGSDKYRLGTRLLELGLTILRRMDFRHEAIVHMRGLVDRFGEVCDLGILDAGQVLYIDVLPSRYTIAVSVAAGLRLPAHCTASGKAILAFLPPEEVNAILPDHLPQLTDHTITSKAALLQQLEEIRRLGWALDNEETEIGVRAVATPIRDASSRAIAAIGIPGPIGRMSPERIEEIAGALVDASLAVSARLGWTGRQTDI
ncbi:MAG: IclR family transcriptional regulator [Anaerolineae bacterium]